MPESLKRHSGGGWYAARLVRVACFKCPYTTIAAGCCNEYRWVERYWWPTKGEPAEPCCACCFSMQLHEVLHCTDRALSHFTEFLARLASIQDGEGVIAARMDAHLASVAQLMEERRFGEVATALDDAELEVRCR